MAFSPLFSTPLTDLGDMLHPVPILSPSRDFCAQIYMRLLDCFEAYGFVKGVNDCASLYFDTLECANHTFQKNRVKAMLKERMRQYRAGLRDKPFEEHPYLDSYIL